MHTLFATCSCYTWILIAKGIMKTIGLDEIEIGQPTFRHNPSENLLLRD
jgi:hypothetical protein